MNPATLLALLFCTVLSSHAWAQDDGMSFGEEEVEDISEVSPVAKFLEEGKKLYGDKKYTEASLLFYKVLQEQDVTADAFKPEAQYELAKTLFQLELYQGALQYFGFVADTGDTHPFFLPALRGLVLLTDVVPEDPVLMQHMAKYTDYYPAEVPEKYRDRFAYLVGRHLYNELDYEGALKMLSAVSTRSPDYPKARYIAAVTHVADYNAEPAVAAFKEVLRYLTTKKDNGTLTEDEENLFDQTNLGMARVFYSTGGYDTSLKYYSRISRKSRYWPVALFESSWAYFQLDLYNKALGNLLTINAPFFDQAYFPEGSILTAVLFFYNCKYERVRYVLEDFEDQYLPIKDEIDAVVAKYSEDPEKMYQWLLDQKAGGENFDMVRVVNSALNDQQIQRKLTLIKLTTEEKAKLSKMPGNWKSSGLATQLDGDLEVAIGFAKSDAGVIAQQRLERASEELQNLVLEQKKIQFEVARAEKGEIEADLRAEMGVEANVTEANVEVTDEELYWVFDGEYWADELGFYIFNVNSECKR